MNATCKTVDATLVYLRLHELWDTTPACYITVDGHKRHISYNDIARHTGYTAPDISRYLAGEPRAKRLSTSNGVVRALCQLFGWSLDYVLHGTGDRLVTLHPDASYTPGDSTARGHSPVTHLVDALEDSGVDVAPDGTVELSRATGELLATLQDAGQDARSDDVPSDYPTLQPRADWLRDRLVALDVYIARLLAKDQKIPYDVLLEAWMLSHEQ